MSHMTLGIGQRFKLSTVRAVTSFAVVLLSAVEAIAQDKPAAFGWLEHVLVYPPGMQMSAKLDTGADSCSVHAEKLEKYQSGGSTWVRFTLTNKFGDTAEVKREIVRNTKIKKKSGGAQKRPVVRFGLCLGGVYEVVECNLVNRAHFQYPVLIGRNLLAGAVLVDSSSTFTVDPACKDVRSPK